MFFLCVLCDFAATSRIFPRVKLDVVQPWYADGLQFTCAQCGNCCTGGPGYVWISETEIERLAEHLKLSVREVKRQHCRKIGKKYSLKEHRNSAGQYDCTFLKEIRVERDGGKVVYPRQVCTIYPVRPLQCRTWPFWEGNLASPAAWKRASRNCHGIDQGRRFTSEQIESLRDATDWPQRPPTSGEHPVEP